MIHRLNIPKEVYDGLPDEDRDYATEEIDFGGWTASLLWLTLSRVFIPSVTHNTVKHIAWRYNMLAYHEHLVHDLSVPDRLMMPGFLTCFVGISAPDIPFKTHNEFVRTRLNPDLPHLSSGQASVRRALIS